MPQYQSQVYFDFTMSEQYARNYLVSPGYTVYLLDEQHQILYKKTINTFEIFDLSRREPEPVQTNQNGSGLSKEEIVQLIRDELSAYNPHIPKKDRRQS